MRQAIRILAWSWAAIIGTAIAMSQGEIIKPLPINRWAAGVFVLAVIVGCMVEIGWAGGDKSKTSHM